MNCIQSQSNASSGWLGAGSATRAVHSLRTRAAVKCLRTSDRFLHASKGKQQIKSKSSLQVGMCPFRTASIFVSDLCFFRGTLRFFCHYKRLLFSAMVGLEVGGTC